MTFAPRSYLRRYGLAIIVTLAAISLTAMTALRTGAPFLLVIVAVLVSTWYGGRGPGLVAIALAVISAIDFIQLPLGSFVIDEYRDLPRLGLFVVCGLLICIMTAERDRAREAAESHARRQAAVAQLGERGLASADARAFVDQASVLLAENLQLDHSYVLELLPDGDSLRLVAGHGWQEGTVGCTVLSRRTLSQVHYTLLSQTPVIVGDLNAENRFAPSRFLLDRGIKSGMTVVVPGVEKPFGVLGAFSTIRRDFTQDDVHFLQAVANVLGNAFQHQQAVDALRQREQAFRALSDHSPDIIHRYDRDLHHLYINDTIERLTGVPAKAFIGKTGEELAAPAPQWSQWETAIRDVLATGQEKRIEVRFGRVPDQRYYESRLVPEFGKDDQVESVLAVTRDITERKRAEQALWESNELLETMFSSIDLMVAYMDRALNFIRVNRAYAVADEHEPEFYVGKNHFALFPNAENEAIFRRVVETGEPFSVYAKPFEYAEHPERGTSHWDWTLQPVKGLDGSVTGVVLSLINVSERIKAQEALQAAAEQVRELAREVILLQEQDRRHVSNVLYNDTAQVMAATLLSLQTICADLPGDLDCVREQLAKASASLNGTIGDVRSLAGDLHPPALETLGLAGAVGGLCQSLARRTGLDIEYTGGEVVGLSDTHAIFLYRFIQEALSNAALHSDAKRVQVCLRKDSSKVIATVQDDGVGFDPQTAVNGRHGRRSSGLAALRERLKLLGGHLEIKSCPAQGTFLTAEIPFS